MEATKKTTRKLREAIATLSTGGVGTYYKNVAAWHSRLEGVLEGYGLMTTGCPPIHTDAGGGYIAVQTDPLSGNEHDPPVSGIAFQWYTMPSRNVEVICYCC